MHRNFVQLPLNRFSGMHTRSQGKSDAHARVAIHQRRQIIFLFPGKIGTIGPIARRARRAANAMQEL